MPIEIKCKCGSEYRLDDGRAGEQFTCKVCGATVTLPAGVGRTIPTEAVPAQTPVATSASATTAPAPPQRPRGGGSPFDRIGEALETPDVTTAPAPAPAVDDSPRIGTKPGTYEAPDVPLGGRLRPPTAWCAGRLAMWGLCVGFLFVPWFSMSGTNPQTDETVTEAVTGWQIVAAVWEGAGQAVQGGSNPSMPPISEFTNLPDGVGRIAAGGGMMVFSPCAYALGLALIAVFGPLAYMHEGKGAVWPFVACLASLVSFIVGWRLIAGAEPLREMLDIVSEVGVTIGVSGWAYTMVFLLIIMCLIARARPDYNLLQAMEWSQERIHSGPL